jgi:hypothetical protein
MLNEENTYLPPRIDGMMNEEKTYLPPLLEPELPLWCQWDFINSKVASRIYIQKYAEEKTVQQSLHLY